MYILNNWAIKESDSRSGTPQVRLVGKVFHHPRFAPGEPISTSTVERYCFETDSVVTHSGSEYRLGKADSSDPLAKQRLLLMLAPGAREQDRRRGHDRRRPQRRDDDQTGMHT